MDIEGLQDTLVEQRELLAQLATARDSGILYRAVAALDNAIRLVHEERESKYAIWPDRRPR